MGKKTHSVAGKVGQCHQPLAKSVVDQEPSHHHIQVEEACAETHQISDHLEFFHYSLLITLMYLTVCLPGGLDLWNLLTSAQMRLMADAQAVTITMLTSVRII